MKHHPERFNKTLYIFRRDLRLYDNTGLHFALLHSESVIPCFIFTPEQIEKNPYRSDHCLQFLIESLEDLEQQLKAEKGRLYLFYGEPDEMIEKAIQKLGVDAVVVNADYTPYSIHRDKKIETVCKKAAVPFHSSHDLLLHPPEEILKNDGKPYVIFTPYFRCASKYKIPLPTALPAGKFFLGSIPFSEDRSIYKTLLPKPFKTMLRGGRSEGKKILKHLSAFKQYAKQRDYPETEGTTHLSPHLKFTTLSPREVYHAIAKTLGPHHELLRSLYWRDFFTAILYFFPHVLGKSFHKKYDKLKWSYDKKTFSSWCEGKTGFPIVDAGMRQLKETGWMHNRVRMIAASFLVKDLHIDWRWGEKFFAQTLIDYDPAVNNGNWQWSASTGCDAQPYFRIFNPWIQQKKFDPHCTYIKKWIPELAAVPEKIIHAWHLEKHRSDLSTYPTPIVDHGKEAQLSLRRYRTVQ